MNIDDCYAEKNRTEDGDIIESEWLEAAEPAACVAYIHAGAERFPSGMRNLTDYIHDLGL